MENIPLGFHRLSHNNNDVIVKIEGRVEDGKMMTMCVLNRGEERDKFLINDAMMKLEFVCFFFFVIRK